MRSAPSCILFFDIYNLSFLWCFLAMKFILKLKIYLFSFQAHLRHVQAALRAATGLPHEVPRSAIEVKRKGKQNILFFFIGGEADRSGKGGTLLEGVHQETTLCSWLFYTFFRPCTLKRGAASKNIFHLCMKQKLCFHRKNNFCHLSYSSHFFACHPKRGPHPILKSWWCEVKFFKQQSFLFA